MFEEYARLKDSALKHLDKAAIFAESIQKKTVSEQLRLGRRTLADSRYNLAIVGDMNRGKSTLVNTLLGRSDDHLSPIRAKVCTSAIAHYMDRNAHPEGVSEAQVFFDDGREATTVPIESLRDYITEEGNPNNIKGVRSVDVYGDFPLLHNVVTLVDTPGRGAVQRNHEILVEQFMPLADAIIFLIDASIPITASEKEFLNQLGKQEKDRIFFVLTKRDEVENKDINTVRNWVRGQISEAGLSCDKLFEVSAKKLFEARRDGLDDQTVEHIHRESGVANLETELESFILANSTKNATMLPRLKKLLDYLRQFYNQANSEMGENLSLMSMDTNRLKEEIRELQDRSKNMKTACDASLRKFKTSWSKSVAQFSQKLENRGDPIADRIIQKIQKGGLIGAAAGSFKARNLIEGAISNELRGLLPELDMKLAEHVTNLSTEIEEEWQTYKRGKAQADLALPAASLLGLGGTALALSHGLTAIMAALSASTNVAAVAVVETGIWTKIVTFFCGGSKVAVAQASALTTITPAVIGVVTFVVVSWAAKQIIIAVQENRIPELVTESMQRIAEEVTAELEKRGDMIAANYKSTVEEFIERDKLQIEEIEKSVKMADPSIKARLSGQADECKKLLLEHNDLNHSLSLISTLHGSHV
jgi:GTP-binding protein EngB required for normal cell division